MQYTLIAGFYGILITLMNAINASLTSVYGGWFSPAIIHLAGLITLLPAALCGWSRRKGRAPWYQYLGGVVGILTVICSNLSINVLGVTLNLVLMLLGQMTCSAIVDHFGLFGAAKHPFRMGKALAILVMTIGCVLMLLLSDGKLSGGSDMIMAVLLGFLSGYTIVIARTFNATLSETAGIGHSTLMNYVTGLTGSVLLFALSGFQLSTPFPAAGQPFTIYLGGVLGALGIFLCNVATPRLSALQMTIITFVGEIFSGVVIDALAGRFSLGTVLGGIAVAIGMLLNMRADAKEADPHGLPHQS